MKDLFVEWFERLDLPFKKGLVPLAHNWAFESSWLKEWLGITLFDEIWYSHARDGMLLAHRHQRPGRLPRRTDPFQSGRPGLALQQVQHRQRQRPRRPVRRPGRGGSLPGAIAVVLRGELWVRSGRGTTGTS